MKYTIIIILLLYNLISYSQIMKPVTTDDSDFKICIVNDSTKSDIIIYIVKLKSAIKSNLCYWYITSGNKFDYTYKVVSKDEPHDFSVYITNCSDCVKIRSEFLKKGLKYYKNK